MKWLNPILVFTIEEVFQILKLSNRDEKSLFEESIFLIDFKDIKFDQRIEFDKNQWGALTKIKTEVNQIIEDLRNKKIIKSSLETKIIFSIDEKNQNVFDKINLSDFFICSSADVVSDEKKYKMQSLDFDNGIKVAIEKAVGKKCDYCWKVSLNPCERKNCAIKK